MACSAKRASLKAKSIGPAPNKSFKPNLLRYVKNMAEKTCHVFASATQVGLTQVLGMTQTVKPHCTVVPASQRYEAIALRSLRFSERDLIIEVQGSGFAFARLTFRNIVGFRALDERDLGEFWPEYSDPNGWLWEVHSGGWMDLEKQRSVFSSPSVAAPLREFFMVEEYCLSVLCQNPPEINHLGADPRHA